MDFDSVLKKRHSTRAFKEKRASWKDIIDAVEAATFAPFAGNNNTLKFLIIENPDLINKVASCCDQRWISEAGIVVIVCGDDSTLQKLYEDRAEKYARQQAGAAIENFILKLTDLGLSTCWIGAYDDELLKSYFEIPKNIEIEAVIAVGYEKITDKGKSKVRHKPIDTMLWWEKWGDSRRPSAFVEPRLHEDTRIFEP